MARTGLYLKRNKITYFAVSSTFDLKMHWYEGSEDVILKNASKIKTLEYIRTRDKALVPKYDIDKIPTETWLQIS